MHGCRSKFATDQSGVTIVEVMVSALLMVMVAAGAGAAFQATGRAAAQERHQARAYSIAQDDQARIRGLTVPQISRLNQTRDVVQDGITYRVPSTGTPTIDRTATAACDAGNSSADYVSVTSKVTWSSMGTRPPVVIDSIVTPPNGSLEANRGALGVSVVDSRSNGYPGLTVTGSGAGTFTGTTDSTGCLLFGDMPAGNYTVGVGAANLVDKDGLAPAPKTASVIGQGSNTVSFQYDRPGTFSTTFTTIKSATTSTFQTSSADRIRVFNNGMTQARVFGGTVGTRVTPLVATSLFPFTSPYSVHAGSCPSNDPTPGGTTSAAALGSSLVPVAGTGPAVSLKLPALNLRVYNGTSSSSAGSLLNGARVTVTDQTCTVNNALVKYVATTAAVVNSGVTTNGTLADPGFPYSTDYDVCVSGTASSGTVKRVTTTDVNLTNPNAARALTVYLNSGVTGPCP